MNWLLFQLIDYRKAIKIEIEYSLITKSGNEVLSRIEYMKPIKPIILKNDWFVFTKHVENDIIYKGLFDKRSEEILKDFRKSKKIRLSNGHMICGDYIIRCKWNVMNVETECMGWKEFKNFHIRVRR